MQELQKWWGNVSAGSEALLDRFKTLLNAQSAPAAAKAPSLAVATANGTAAAPVEGLAPGSGPFAVEAGANRRLQQLTSLNPITQPTPVGPFGFPFVRGPTTAYRLIYTNLFDALLFNGG